MISYIRHALELEAFILAHQKNPLLNEAVFQSIDFSSKEDKTSTEEALHLASQLPVSIKKYFNVDIMPFNKDILRLVAFLKTLVKHQFYGIRTEDLSLLNIIEEQHLDLKVIIDSTTGGNNIKYYEFFKPFASIERIVLSRELSLEQIKHYAQNQELPLEIQAYGRLQIFHTRRKLIEAIETEKEESVGKLLYLQEPKRDQEYFPLLETHDGTMMFHSHLLNTHAFQKDLQALGVVEMLDLRHVETKEHYTQVLHHFLGIEYSNLSALEKHPFLKLKKGEINKEYHSILTPKTNATGLQKVGIVLDSKKGKELILKSDIELKLDMELIFYNNKAKELVYEIKYLNKFGDRIYIIPWRKGVTSNSPFYIRNHEAIKH